MTAENKPNDGEKIQAYVDDRFETLSEQIKERETSFLRALKTLVVDWRAYQTGEREKFPNAAVLGAIFAYLRPRIVIVLGSIAAVIIAIAQIWILVSQTNIIEHQSLLIEEQNETSKRQAVTAILSGLDPTNAVQSELAVTQLAVYGDAGFEVLLSLGRSNSELGYTARTALTRALPQHTDEQIQSVFDLLLQVYNDSLSQAIEEFFETEDIDYISPAAFWEWLDYDEEPTESGKLHARSLAEAGNYFMDVDDLLGKHRLRSSSATDATAANIYTSWMIMSGFTNPGLPSESYRDAVFLDSDLTELCRRSRGVDYMPSIWDTVSANVDAPKDIEFVDPRESEKLATEIRIQTTCNPSPISQ